MRACQAAAWVAWITEPTSDCCNGKPRHRAGAFFVGLQCERQALLPQLRLTSLHPSIASSRVRYVRALGGTMQPCYGALLAQH